MGQEFNKALGNFITDFAGGGAIRHLADQGYTVTEITMRLDYPVPKDKVATIVWEHYLNEGIICLDEPGDVVEKVSYIKEQDAYGKISMRRIVEQIDTTDRDYVLIDFGRLMYKNKGAFIQSLEALEKRDRDYVLDLPWPLKPVYHINDDRIQRILKAKI